MPPRRLLHGLPVAERLQAEFKHPIRLTFLLRNESHNILGQSYGNDLSMNIGSETVFILLFRHLADVFVFLCHYECKVTTFFL